MRIVEVSAARPQQKKCDFHDEMLLRILYKRRVIKRQCDAAKEGHLDASQAELLGSCLASLEKPDLEESGRLSSTK